MATFNVKDKSLHTFFGITAKERDRDISAYHLMKDEIVLPNRPDVSVGQELMFELEDVGRDSGKRLINSYTYSVSKYDDVSIKLTLTRFFVSVE